MGQVETVEVHPVSGRIGAKIVGVDLSADLSNEVISQIRQTLVQYKVIFFRGNIWMPADRLRLRGDLGS